MIILALYHSTKKKKEFLWDEQSDFADFFNPELTAMQLLDRLRLRLTICLLKV
jgi:hypothetical protein